MAIIQQGRFTSTGTTKILALSNGVDWIRVYNETNLIQNTVDLPYEYYYQFGMSLGRGVVWVKLGNVANDPVTVAQIAAGSGFTPLDANSFVPTFATITSSTDTTTPVFTVASTVGLSSGDTVRLSPITGQRNISGNDWTITVLSATTFSIGGNGFQQAPGAVGTGGNYGLIRFDPLFTPSSRLITNITDPAGAGFAVFTLNKSTGWAPGQKVRIKITDPRYASVQLNDVVCTVTAVSNVSTDLRVTTDLPFAGFTPFVFPLAANVVSPISPAQLIPFGENTAYDLSFDPSLNTLTDATRNIGVVGVALLPGATAAAAGPAGFTAGNIMYWIAGSSDAITNT